MAVIKPFQGIRPADGLAERIAALPYDVYSREEARKEARAFLEVIAPYKGRISYPLSSDYEGDSIRYAKQCGYAPTPHTVTEQTVAFLETLE